MKLLASALLTLIAVLTMPAVRGAGLGDAGSALGFGYCPPPVVPSCIERAAKMRGHKDLEACGRDVLRFTQTLGTYRTCLARESERAIGSGNDAIARFRCLSQRRGSCSRIRDETER